MLTSFMIETSTCDSVPFDSPLPPLLTLSSTSSHLHDSHSPIYPTIRLFLIFTTVCLFVKLLLSSRLKSCSSSLPLPPGPRGIPFLGFLPFLDKDFHVTLTSLSQKFGPVYQIYLGGKRVVVLNDAKIVREAFRQPVFSGRPDTELTKILQGYGMCLLDYFIVEQVVTFNLDLQES